MEVGEDVDIDAELDEINGLLKDVPSSPFDWDSRADQDAIDHFYLSDVTSFRQVFSTNKNVYLTLYIFVTRTIQNSKQAGRGYITE